MIFTKKSCLNCKHDHPQNPYCEVCMITRPFSKWEPKKMEFIKKYHFDTPQIIHQIDDNGMDKYITSIVEKIHVASIERHDKALIDEIIKVAEEKGITDLYILNKESIVEALSKQIPKMPSIYPVVGLAVCPTCENRIEAHASHNYCCYCGQKLEWMRKKD